MRSELKTRPHNVLPGEIVYEIWYCGEFIGTVTPGDGPMVRVVSKHDLTISQLPGFLNVAEIKINPSSRN